MKTPPIRNWVAKHNPHRPKEHRPKVHPTRAQTKQELRRELRRPS